MKVFSCLLVLLLFACQTDKPSIFKSLIGKTDVEIYLADYDLQTVPKDIGDLKGVKRLYISKDSTTGFIIYPPLSALGNTKRDTVLKHLPGEITDLTSLQSLVLVNLDLATLPAKLERLQNLDTLILFMNKLTVSNELDKIKKLKGLKYLGLLGNELTADDLVEIKKAIPGIVINPGLR
jgi:Leucine-rich repeat (LRR) protein